MAIRILIGSLGFQMTAAILGLALLFGAGGLYTLRPPDLAPRRYANLG